MRVIRLGKPGIVKITVYCGEMLQIKIRRVKGNIGQSPGKIKHNSLAKKIPGHTNPLSQMVTIYTVLLSKANKQKTKDNPNLSF